MTAPVEILGAGLSGLSAAINLAKGGREVKVYESRPDVGMAVRPNWQGLLRTHGTHEEYLKRLNLEPKFETMYLSKCILCSPSKDNPGALPDAP